MQRNYGSTNLKDLTSIPLPEVDAPKGAGLEAHGAEEAPPLKRTERGVSSSLSFLDKVRSRPSYQSGLNNLGTEEGPAEIYKPGKK